MPAAGALFALLFALTILGTIGLWYLIDRETAGSETMRRADAERAVRQDTHENRENGDRNGSDSWGSDAEWATGDDSDAPESEDGDGRR